MELKVLFPQWRAASTNPHIDWDREIDLSDDAAFLSLLVIIVEDQAASSQNRPHEFTPICNAIMVDILALQQAPPDNCKAINLQYLQFEATLTPLRMALNAGNFGLTHDWIIDGCGENLAHTIERPFQHGRIAEFMASDIPWIVGNRGTTLTDWSCAFYYYCRTRAALFNLAVIILPSALQAIDEMPPFEERAIECRCVIANWLIDCRHPGARALALALEMMFDAAEISPASRIRIAVLFATVATGFTHRPAKEWASWALEHGGQALGSHEPFQLLWAQIDTVEDWDRWRVEVFAAAAYYAFSLRHLGTPTAIVQATDQRSALLNPAVMRLAQFERGADLLTMLTEWYGVPQNKRFTGGPLFVIPGYEGGFAYLSKVRQLLPAGGEKQFANLIAVTNESLGLTLTVRGEQAGPPAPERGAEPAYALGPRFADTLANSYRFDALDTEMLADRHAIISFSGHPHPLQALMAAAPDGTILPISSSLQQPEADRPIRRALLWAAENDYYSSFEIEAVQAILTRAGVNCDRKSGVGSRPEDFLPTYADPEYDLIWVAGHGEIDRWRDGSARLVAGDNCLIGIDALVAHMPDAAGRRLLMLNICDGGVSAVNGGIHRLGLAPMLANARQATISHLWPVRPPVAAAFGALTADALTRYRSHFDAFVDTLLRMHAPSSDVSDAVRQIIPEQELVQRLENADLEMDNIFNWGSAAFFQ
jgi:hypothetical protein